MHFFTFLHFFNRILQSYGKTNHEFIICFFSIYISRSTFWRFDEFVSSKHHTRYENNADYYISVNLESNVSISKRFAFAFIIVLKQTIPFDHFCSFSCVFLTGFSQCFNGIFVSCFRKCFPFAVRPGSTKTWVRKLHQTPEDAHGKPVSSDGYKVTEYRVRLYTYIMSARCARVADTMVYWLMVRVCGRRREREKKIIIKLDVATVYLHACSDRVVCLIYIYVFKAR